jgi:hypothetical protein
MKLHLQATRHSSHDQRSQPTYRLPIFGDLRQISHSTPPGNCQRFDSFACCVSNRVLPLAMVLCFIWHSVYILNLGVREIISISPSPPSLRPCCDGIAVVAHFNNSFAPLMALRCNREGSATCTYFLFAGSYINFCLRALPGRFVAKTRG